MVSYSMCMLLRPTNIHYQIVFAAPTFTGMVSPDHAELNLFAMHALHLHTTGHCPGLLSGVNVHTAAPHAPPWCTSPHCQPSWTYETRACQ
jgi:hypothetical protein